MSFFAVLFALLIEQLKPLPRDNWIHQALAGWVRWTGRNFDAGQPHHTWVVWCISVGVPTVVVALLHVLISRWNVLFALAFDVLMLYVTLGFRQFSHYFTDIRDALEQGDEDRARSVLQEWRHLDASELPRTELLRHVIEHALLAAHRHVFGVFFWFVLGSALGLGPVGAVVYRMSEFCARYWAFKIRAETAPVNGALMLRSQAAFSVLDHVPARLTAAGFAVVGNFEEAVDCWRQCAGLWKQSNDGILLSAAAGACGVSLGGAEAPSLAARVAGNFAVALPGEEVTDGQGSTPGAPPTLAHLRSVVGLVWRSMVLWMMLLALLSLANRLG